MIPWFSFGGLALVLGLGSFMLHGTLKQQLLEQTKSQLDIKSKVLLLSEQQLSNRAALSQTIAAFTEKQDYSAVYLQIDGNLALASSVLNFAGVSNPDIPLGDQQILEQAIARSGKVVQQMTTIEGRKYALAAQALTDSDGKLQGILVHGSSVQSINTIVRSSLLAQSVLSLVILILIIYLSKILGQAIAEPITSLQKVAQNFSAGNFSARANINSQDEVGLLSSTFNVLADSIELNEARLKQEAQRSQLLQEIAYSISQAGNVQDVWQTAVESSRNVLKCDRVIYHHFTENWQGKIVAEAVTPGLPIALGIEINDPCFAEGYASAYREGKVKAITNIYHEDLHDCHLKMLEPLAVVASLITPVVTADKLAGLLVAHQCSEARAWQIDEISLLTQIAQQVGRTVDKIELLKQQQQAQQQERAAKETLQRRAMELLMEVDPVSQGDLTVQVKVQEDEIGTIGDSYNATIESLRRLVSQVKTAAIQVSSTTSDKDRSIKELS
ncbi:MAG: HAMP domain-containing protein, partial [Cyanobacteria bacterium J06631_2]